jgi:adenosylcobinamide-phosphate synthase
VLELVVMLPAAFALDALLGDPVYPLHPVRLIGGLARLLEKLLRALAFDGVFGGALLVLAELAVFAGAYLAARWGLWLLNPWAGWPLDLFLAYSCLALKDLVRHARPVAAALEAGDLAAARGAVSMIVGRDVERLDQAGVARAGVESVAESFVDGFLGPVFWYAAGGALGLALGPHPAAGGVLGMLLHKVASTLDSTIGFRDERYERFGKVAARLDDVVHFLPARLAVPLMTAAAWFCGLDWRSCWRVGLRDRLKHESPNAAHSEACAAGALGLRLGGPTVYPDGEVDKPWLGDGRAEAAAADVRRCCRLVICSAALSLVAALALLGPLAAASLALGRPASPA